MTFDSNQKKAIKSCLQEISNSFTRIEAERDNVKEIIKRMAEEFQINKKLSRKLAKVFHKRNLEEEVASASELADTYENVVNP